MLEGLPRSIMTVAGAVAIIGGASIDTDSSSAAPGLLKTAEHPLPPGRPR